jgi:copper chaperone CopZ
MKRWILVVIVGVGLLGISCRRQDVRPIMIDVPGMRTGEHVAMIMQAMRTIPGVDTNSVRVDFTRHTITVRYESLVASLKNIEMAIAEAGFAANDVPANAVAAARVAAAATNRPVTQGVP